MRSFAFASLCVLAACGKSDSGKKDDIAKAFSGPASKQDGDPAKRMADLKAKAEADATKARNDELEKVTADPPDAPDLEKACADAGAAFDEFKQQRIVAEELGRWNATKEPDIRKVVDACKSAGNPRIATCQAKALRTATVANFGPDSGPEIIEHCTKRWGGEAPGGAAPGGAAG